MKCKFHPDRDAVAICEKFGVGYCGICCNDSEGGCLCSSPRQHCKFRPQCLVWELSREKRRRHKELP